MGNNPTINRGGNTQADMGVREQEVLSQNGNIKNQRVPQWGVTKIPQKKTIISCTATPAAMMLTTMYVNANLTTGRGLTYPMPVYRRNAP